jgi:HlyD family secretion protein
VIFTIAQDLAKMEVHTNVAESDIGRLKSGMRVSFTVDAYPGEQFRGSIRDIRNAPQVVQNVVTYDAVIDVSNDDLKLKPGMTATVSVVTDRRRDVLAVPNAALRFRPDTGGGPGPRASAPAGANNPPGGQSQAGAPQEGGQRRQWQGNGNGNGNGAGNWQRQRGDSDDAVPAQARTIYTLVNGKPVPHDVTTGITDGRVTEIASGDLKEGDAVIVAVAGQGTGPQQRGQGQGQRPGGFRIL